MRISDWSSDVCSSDLSRLAKGFCSTNCGDEGRGVESVDAVNRRQALGHFVRAGELGKLLILCINAAIESSPFRAHVDQKVAETAGNQQIVVSEHLINGLLVTAS